MFDIAMFLVLPGVITVGLGAGLSWLVVRWLPLKATAKAVIYSLLFIVLFTPLFFPVAAAGTVVIPALGFGFFIFWWTPWNFALIPASVLFAVLSARRMFLLRQSEHA